MQYKRIITVAFLMLILVACGSSEPTEGDIQTAIALTAAAVPTDTPVSATDTAVPTDTPLPTNTPLPTETPEPTETPLPTAIPLSEIDLQPILVQPGDLPGHLEPEQISDQLLSQSLKFTGVPEPDNFINQNFFNSDRSGGNGGSVILFLYEDLAKAYITYSQATAGFGGRYSLDINEEAGERYRGYVSPPQAHYAFLRCGAVAYIWMIDATGSDASNFARRLDSRLTELLCPE